MSEDLKEPAWRHPKRIFRFVGYCILPAFLVAGMAGGFMDGWTAWCEEMRGLNKWGDDD